MALEKEAQVMDVLSSELDKLGWNFVIHVPGSHQSRDEYEEVLSRNRVEGIHIGNSIPDFLGFNQAGEVCAIEAKGKAGHQDAVGSAFEFKKGAHKSYVAGPPELIRKANSVSNSSQLGMIEVTENGVEWEHPSLAENRTLLPDIRAQLKYRLENWTSMSTISSQRLSQPVNYFSPVIILADRGTKSTVELKEQLCDDFDVRDTEAIVRGALSLNLIDREEERYTLTDDGKLSYSVLRGEDICTLSDLINLKDRTSYNGCLYVESSSIATLLRKQYTSHPEFRHLMTVLNEIDGGSITLPQITMALAREYPNSFVNIFVAKEKAKKAREIIEKEGPNHIHEDMDLWKELILQNIFDNFTRQLRQIGVLDYRTSVHSGKKSDFEPGEYPWIMMHEWF